jgi:hypothetical protein
MVWTCSLDSRDEVAYISIRESFDNLPLENNERDQRITLRWHLNSKSILTLFTVTVITDGGHPISPFMFTVLKVCSIHVYCVKSL